MVFENVEHFGQSLNPMIFQEERQKYPNIVLVVDLFNSIHKGCGCTRRVRIDGANKGYQGLINVITDEEKTWLKSKFNNEELIFKENGQILYQF